MGERWGEFVTWARVFDPEYDPEIDPPAHIFCAWHCLQPPYSNIGSAASCLSKYDPPKEAHLLFVLGYVWPQSLLEFETACESQGIK